MALKEREEERKYTRAIIMLPIPQVRAVCLELSRRKANPFSKHILEWLSTGSPDASSSPSDGEDHRNIVHL